MLVHRQISNHNLYVKEQEFTRKDGIYCKVTTKLITFLHFIALLLQVLDSCDG